ncbi:sigma-70 family RNA polymerase sigma factor [Dactylosporangium sp. NPDC049140]|uniref:RNA polymerase sigma factor n=1 Tax=Dactylosporangium sp. NPDC049140 TaxID=3155647 RepID=UPI0033E4B387
MEADEDLLARVARGDGAALTRLAERHRRALFGVLVRLLGDRCSAEEALQDTLLAVWRGAGGFAARSSVRTWLFGIARRQAAQRLRRRDPPPAELADELRDPAPGPEEVAVLAAGGSAVAAAVSRLPEHHREVVALVLVGGLPLADAAAILGVPVGTVKSRLFHARAAVVAMLAEEE